MEMSITGWSPFIPGDADNSSLPVASVEYTFKNTSNEKIEAVFSYHAENFMRMETISNGEGDITPKAPFPGSGMDSCWNSPACPTKPHYKGDFAIFTDHKNTVTDLAWFRGGWFDSRTMIWKDLSEFTFSEDTTHDGITGGFPLCSAGTGTRGRGNRMSTDGMVCTSF